MKNNPECVFLTHGEEEAATSLAAQLRGQTGWQIRIPDYQEQWDLD